MENIFDFADELGPIKIVHVYDPKCGLRGIVAIDNVARGPSIGGVRMAPDVSAEEAFRLARAMTMKNSAANLPHGIIVDDIGLSGVLVREKEFERPIVLRAESWVPEQERLFYATAQVEGNQSTRPLVIKVTRPD